MKILVTGGSGLTGRPVINNLITNGYDVTSIDLIPPGDTKIDYKLVNTENIGEVFCSLKNIECVVHLAAIPRPTFHSSDVVFRTNILSTFNIFEACAQLGIRKIIYASSISVLGYPFYRRFFEPEYLPIDEGHPNKPQDPYALSKYLGEEIAKAYVRSHGMDVVSLRLAWIHTPESFKNQLEPMWDDPSQGASNLWLYVDSRDVAQACRLAIEKNLEGHNPFYITANNTFMKTPSLKLAKMYYPHAEIRPGFGENQSFISTNRAKELLDFTPQYCWGDYYSEGS